MDRDLSTGSVTMHATTPRKPAAKPGLQLGKVRHIVVLADMSAGPGTTVTFPCEVRRIDDGWQVRAGGERAWAQTCERLEDAIEAGAQGMSHALEPQPNF